LRPTRSPERALRLGVAAAQVRTCGPVGSGIRDRYWLEGDRGG
jgi:hypothetical protein